MVQGGATPQTLSCIEHNFARSTVPKAFLDAPLGNYGESSFRSTLGPQQPFVFAGDTILTADCEPLNNNFTAISCKVLVHRIYGGDMNQMTLVNTNVALPALAPPLTPAMMEDVIHRSTTLGSAITVPYSLTNHPWTQNPAVATEEAIFYAVNPYWQVPYCPQLPQTHKHATLTPWKMAALRGLY